jgi:ATP phosphoribosyltransferase regulatory subunit HisZ
MATSEDCPRPLRRQDAAVLVGVVGILEGELTLAQLDPELTDSLRRRFARERLLAADASDRDVRQALSDLAQRLHYVYGSYDDPPVPVPVPD